LDQIISIAEQTLVVFLFLPPLPFSNLLTFRQQHPCEEKKVSRAQDFLDNNAKVLEQKKKGPHRKGRGRGGPW
jgi:hypothetical protein